MKPILYSTVTEGAVPTNYGVGALCDCISCKVTEERNGAFELVMEYAAEGVHASDIQVNSIIKAKPNFTDDPQLFRIYKVGKVIDHRFTCYGQHISYDLSGKLITEGSAGSCVAACALLQTKAGNFTITTDKSVTASFSVSEPSSVRSWFGGKAGSLLDVYGGEWKYDNYTATLKQARGSDRGVEIRYGKNLTNLSQELNMENLCTGVVPYYIDQDGNKTVGAKVLTGLTLDVPRDLAIDFSSDVNEESATPILTQLANLATNYVNKNNLTNPTDSIDLDFVQISSLQERVDLCDTVHIYFEALGISATAKCIKTEWDVLEERYTSTTFGDARTNIADTIVAQQKEVAGKPSTSQMDQAVERATKLITGNLGGFIVIHDSNNDGYPDELLIMDTDNISTAQKLWRFNKNGLGYSSTGYNGTYGLAMTANGEIVADFVTTGTMSADRVRTGMIASTNNQLQIDLDNGTITAPSITLHGQDVETTLDSLVQTSVVTSYALSNSGTTIPSAFPLTQPTQPTEQQPYLWSKTVYTYANGQSNTSYGVSVRGNNGTDGADGAGLAILGNYDTMADLIAAHPTGSAGDAYMVGTDLAVWNTQTNSWEDVGRIQGPSGADGLWLVLENDDDGTNANVTYTGKLIKGLSTDVTTLYDSIFTWYMVKESGVTELATNTPTITVARDSANFGAVIRCVCIAVVNEEPLQDYSYVTIQDYSGNDIQIVAANNVKLIGESAIYKPYAIESEFQVLSDQISSKVSQTDFNSLSGTVTTQGTLIQQNASAILLKADTSTVNTALNGKMGTDMSNRSSSILIDSGQIRFDSNSLVVNSSQFTLDSSGNATFGGKITAAELYIGGAYVGLDDAINNAEADAISAAATDATNKANAAQNNAINSAVSTAAADATTKANNAKNSAISSANSYTDTGLATKVGNTEVRTKFAADTHSVEIQSGTIKFKSNTLLVDSTQFTLDANGNAVFKGNLSAATLVIGGQTTNIGTAIDNAEADAISAAASDATTKANNAKNSAISSANSYTDTGLAGKVGNSEVRTKFAADNHSVTISSGTIAFNSNTLSIDADNLKVTNTGSVKATNFIAKSLLRIVNDSDVVLVSIQPTTNGGLVAVGKTDTTQVGTMWATENGGFLALSNSSGSTRLTLAGNTGNITADGAASFGGAITCGGLTAKTQIVAADSTNITRVFFNAGSYGYGAFKNSSGNNNIYFYGNTGDIEIAGRIITGSSRKIKKNIEPIEDSEKILELQAVSFDYIDEEVGTNRRGFIAEDVAEILPNLVQPEKEERPAGVDYISMIPYLQDVIKKQEERIRALEEKLEALTEREDN